MVRARESRLQGQRALIAGCCLGQLPASRQFVAQVEPCYGIIGRESRRLGESLQGLFSLLPEGGGQQLPEQSRFRPLSQKLQCRQLRIREASRAQEHFNLLHEQRKAIGALVGSRQMRQLPATGFVLSPATAGAGVVPSRFDACLLAV